MASLDDLVNSLKEEAKTAYEEEKYNKSLVLASSSKTFDCKTFSYCDKYPAPKTDEERHREVLAAKCPKCENVDNRFMLEHDKNRSSFGVVETYAGSGQDLRCFCCNHTFKFCTGKLWYEKLNCVPVPLSWVREELGVDIALYM